MTIDSQNQHILERNQAMLNSVVQGDWDTYASFCSHDLSCFEAETEGVLAEGLAFHRFYFASSGPTPGQSTTPGPQVTMARPHLRWLSEDAVVVSYTRLTQRWDGSTPHTSRCCETRIWQKIEGQWLQVHVHRS